jgi:hypothetical protein
MKKNNIPPCKICGEYFDNIFDATDHLLDDSGSEPFDPKLILSNGYSLMIGSLLRCMYKYAYDPKQIETITQSTYATLYASESGVGNMRELVEDIIVGEQMSEFDKELRQLLKEEDKDGK